ncbi:hypothetical protein ABT263_25410 [Kitasatospora sp. NPDC001603]|uniref:hypothetical protein n=1 Tax=Kitasatospora sp. NPDC001603 TaxID=3154388 RepID=UPI00331F09F8
MAINRYGTEARAYWRRWLPTRYAALPDPVAFFTALGEQVEALAGDLWDQYVIADAAPADETHEERVARLAQLKARAEHEVLDEMVRLEPEPGAGLDDEDDGLESDEEHEARLAHLERHTEWVSTTTEALLDGNLHLSDLDDHQLRHVLDYMTPSFLRLFGTSVEDLRARGRDL